MMSNNITDYGTTVLVYIFLYACYILYLCAKNHIEGYRQQSTVSRTPTISTPENRKSLVLAALVEHVVTQSDLRQDDRESLQTKIKTTTYDRSEEPQLLESGESSAVTDIETSSFFSAEVLSVENNAHGFFHQNSTVETSPIEIQTGDATITEAAPTSKNVDFSICPICLVEYNEEEIVCWSKNPSCTHVFHRDCLLPWLMTHDTCPNCRCSYMNTTQNTN